MTALFRLLRRLLPALLGVVLLAASPACMPPTTTDTATAPPSERAVSTLAGTAGRRGSINGVGAAARFFDPAALAVDAVGTVYVADAGNNSIRKITAAGVVSTLAGAMGSPSVGDSADLVVRFGIPLGTGLADGPGAMARFSYPTGVAVDAAGTVYVADAGNYTIRKVTPAGVVTTLAGTAGSRGYVDGPGTAARFGAPVGIAVDARGTVYVSDVVYHNIRKITAAGVVSTLAGVAGGFGRVDGPGAQAGFHSPMGLAVDHTGTVYVADMGNHAIRAITAAGVVSTLAGTDRSIGGTDGTGAGARFYGPTGVALGAAGKLYVADELNHAIRVIE